MVAAFITYVALVDQICSSIPHFLAWTHANPTWLRQAASSAVAVLAGIPGWVRTAASGLAAVAADPAALQQAAGQAASSLLAALRATASGVAAAVSPPDWLRAVVAGLLAAMRQRLAGA